MQGSRLPEPLSSRRATTTPCILDGGRAGMEWFLSLADGGATSQRARRAGPREKTRPLRGFDKPWMMPHSMLCVTSSPGQRGGSPTRAAGGKGSPP